MADGEPPPRKKVYLRAPMKGKCSDNGLEHYEVCGDKYVCGLCRTRWEWRKAQEPLYKGPLLVAVGSQPAVQRDAPQVPSAQLPDGKQRHTAHAPGP